MRKITLIDIQSAAFVSGNYNFPPGKFVEAAQEWITEEDEIIAFKVDAEEGNILVVVEQGANAPEDEGCYDEPQRRFSLMRFFPMAGEANYNLSVDKQGQSVKEMMNVLLNL